MKFKALISKYAGDRLHIEIPKEKRRFFNPGQNVTVSSHYTDKEIEDIIRKETKQVLEEE